MNVNRYSKKINSLFNGKKDERYEIYEHNGIQYPMVAQFQEKDVGCFFLSTNPELKRGYIELKYLRIYNQKKGFGTKLLELLCKEADIYKVTLCITPQSDEEKESISLEKLKKWYCKFGFESESEYVMMRKPII